MKKAILILGIICILMGLHANRLDDAMAALFEYCSVTSYFGNDYLLTNSSKDSKEAAIQFLAWSATVILPVVEEWIEVEPTYSSRLSKIEGVGVSWSTPYTDFVVSISLNEIKNQFDNDDYEGFEDLMAAMESYLQSHAQVSLRTSFK